MNRFTPFLLTASMVAIIGCSKPEVDFSVLTVGMTKAQVVDKVGKPTRVSVTKNLEIFEYEAYDAHSRPFVGVVRENYRIRFVRFIDGKVESFGNKGDFDSTKTPTTKLEVDQKIAIDKREELVGGKATGTPAPTFDLKTELEKLEKMKKDGLITEQEYKELRQRALDKAKVH